ADEALQALREAARLDSNLEPAAVSMSRLYGLKADQAQSERWLDVAIKEEPRNPKAHLARAGWLLERNRAAEARPHADALARLTPASADLKRLRGLIARHLRNADEAEAQFQALLQEAPADASARDQLAQVLADQTDPAKLQRARELAEANARLLPNDAGALATLGWVQFRLGQVEQAEQSLRQAASRGPISSDT